ncbi:MAG: HAMP domain-containing histidine kinase [Dorea sp.]|nr:HAMP domain-containing histidine kinase [Dorea sp.]
MFGRKTLDRIEQMVDDAIAGDFRESDYDETQLSRVESKWKHYLGLSALTRENMEREKENVKGLVSDISHQTKTPMANIRLYTELLRENLESEEDSAGKQQNLRLLDEISRQSEKLEFLIQSLTKMSRLESNIVEVKPRRQKVSELISAVVRDAVPKAVQKGVEIVNIYDGDGCADYDMKWTKEALGNVVDNAVKYSRPGGRVQISAKEYGWYTAISVKDHGIGVREEDTAKIFGRFYRAGEVQQEEGVGIGLYLTREILRKENGYIKVKSKPGEGAEFVLFLRKGNE